MATPAPAVQMNCEQFYQWLDEETHAEWVRGEVVLMSPVGFEHQKVTEFLLQVVGVYVRTRRLGQLLYEPFQMKLEHSSRSPDLLFVSNANLHRLQESYLDGAADLAVEVISPESRARDRGEKFYEYEAAGVREYWLIDPERKRAEFYQLGEDGVYQAVLIASTGVYHSKVLEGLWIQVEWLWQQPEPLEVFRAWGLLDSSTHP
ncbi:MAG: Uma2 family endonuclease [Armatimonadota bacterium]|nr:Uma2 family endonuclease [bacterium]MDW8320084.1 Uma2 family endonuclease [Armatimonadota bacterium]